MIPRLGLACGFLGLAGLVNALAQAAIGASGVGATAAGVIGPFVVAPQTFAAGVPNFTGPGTLLPGTGAFPTVFGGPVHGAIGAVGFPTPVYIVIEGATAAPPPSGGTIVSAPGAGQFAR